MMDPQIIFQGIDSPEVRSEVKSLMDDLIQLCPSDSAVKATFQHLQDSFMAEIKIASESVCMQAVDQAAGLADVLEHVKSKLLSQIVDWRNHRFAS
jgi:hypothetical protein